MTWYWLQLLTCIFCRWWFFSGFWVFLDEGIMINDLVGRWANCSAHQRNPRIYSSFWSDHEATSKNHVVHVQWRSKSCLESLLIQRSSFSNLGLGGASQLVQRSPHQKYPSSMYRLYRVYPSGLWTTFSGSLHPRDSPKNWTCWVVFQEFGPMVLASGGFGADFGSDSLLATYRPDLLHLPTTNGEHCTGLRLQSLDL